MIRLFTALEIPETAAEDLLPLQTGVPGARWRPAEALHVTLRFFGEIPEAKAAELDAELNRITGRPFEIELQGVGTFGEGDDIRALWAGVKDSEALRVLAGRCESAARRVGLEPEHRIYRPHVTLAYSRRPDPAKVAAWIQQHNLLATPPIRVTWFGLWSSWLSGEGSRYDLEREYGLIG